MRWVNSSSICARLGVLQCKVVHRVHWSKSKLAHIYPDIDPKCDKCRQRPANLSHMFWSCPTHAPFWTCVFDSLSDITSANIQPSPLLALFGVCPIGLSLPSYFAELVAFLAMLARRAILLHWKNPFPPTHSQWIKDALHFERLEKIKHTRFSERKFHKIWQPFLGHVRSLHIDIDPDV